MFNCLIPQPFKKLKKIIVLMKYLIYFCKIKKLNFNSKNHEKNYFSIINKFVIYWLF